MESGGRSRLSASTTDDARSRPEVLAALTEQARRIAPVTMAGELRLPVLPALADVVPGGIQRGSIVGVGGPGSRSLAMALVAGVLGGDRWAALVGCDDLCLGAAEASGVPLHRLVLVGQPQRSNWSAVISSLLDAFTMVVVSPRTVRGGDVRKLRTRARDRGGVVVDLSGAWPEAHDLSLRVIDQRWVGLGPGHGVLEARRVVVDVGGRRGAHRSRTVPLWLPGPDGAPAPAEPTRLSEQYAGADIAALDDPAAAGVDALRSVS